jgi:hypothetical protein
VSAKSPSDDGEGSTLGDQGDEASSGIDARSVSENVFPYSRYASQDITISSIDGELITNEAMYGKFIVVHFIRSYDPEETHFILDEAWQGGLHKLPKSQVELLLVNINTDYTPSSFREFNRSLQYKSNWTLAFSYDGQFKGNYTVVINPVGETVYSLTNPTVFMGDTIRDLIDKYP